MDAIQITPAAGKSGLLQNVEDASKPMNRKDRRAAMSNKKRREVCGAIISERILEDGTIEQLHATRGYRRYRAV